MDRREPADRRRRGLSQRGGRITTAGEPEAAQRLASAIAQADRSSAEDLTQGFHAYPARMHPVLARELLAEFTQPGDVVLDPFVGSGTVLIEALVLGCRAQGVDVSPLALRVAEVQCALRNAAERARFDAVLARVTEASLARVRGREAVTVPIARAEREHYEPHVLLELSGLWAEIQAVPARQERRALELVFSTLLIKFSRLRADTAEEHVAKRIRKGLVSEFFLRKGRELGQRWEALFEAAPLRAPDVRLALGDARRLPELLGARFRADLVLSSPPYGGTYDYAQQHALRSAWLRLDLSQLRAAEIGARRAAGASGGGRGRWERDLAEVLAALRAVLREHGAILLWLGDAEFEGVRVPALEQLDRLAPRADLRVIASAAQDRTDPRGGPLRQESLVLLKRSVTERN